MYLKGRFDLVEQYANANIMCDMTLSDQGVTANQDVLTGAREEWRCEVSLPTGIGGGGGYCILALQVLHSFNKNGKDGQIP